MKRILLSMFTVLLVAAAATQLVWLQEGDATAAPEQPAFDSVAAVEATRAEAWPELMLSIAQVEPSPFGFDEPVTVAPAPSSKRTIKVPVTKTVYEERVIEMPAATPLQQRYSVLMLQRAQRMTEEELELAIAEIETELKEQDEAANFDLHRAIEILETLQQDSDGTPAARRAGQALPILHGNPSVQGIVPVYSGDGSAIPHQISR